MNTGLPGHDHNDCEDTTESECSLYGHSFEGFDENSEICSTCGEIREYATRGRRSRSAATENDIHVCRSAGDHAFGLNRICLYCGKSEGDLTSAEREHHESVRRERRGTVSNEGDIGLLDD